MIRVAKRIKVSGLRCCIKLNRCGVRRNSEDGVTIILQNCEAGMLAYRAEIARGANEGHSELTKHAFVVIVHIDCCSLVIF